jgi:hypothetical protein
VKANEKLEVQILNEYLNILKQILVLSMKKIEEVKVQK